MGGRIRGRRGIGRKKKGIKEWKKYKKYRKGRKGKKVGRVIKNDVL